MCIDYSKQYKHKCQLSNAANMFGSNDNYDLKVLTFQL